jgi:hypothetical protein
MLDILDVHERQVPRRYASAGGWMDRREEVKKGGVYEFVQRII